MSIYGTDGIMSPDFSHALTDPELVAGAKGTRPMPLLPAEFTNRVQEFDSSVQDFRFVGETYDAVVISAVAAELAGTTDPAVIREYIIGVTAVGERCETPAACLALARDGTDVAYRGVSLTAGFTDRGEPAVTSYETAHFGRDGFLDPQRSQFIAAGDISQVTDVQPPTPGPRPDGPSWEVEPLVFGGMLPETGALAGAYPGLYAAAQLAIEDINDAGGVLGVDVEWIDGDTGTDPEIAQRTLASHIDDGVHVLIGPAASGVTVAIMEEAVAAGMIIFSPSNTAAELIDADHDGYFFRTAPPDTLQGAALADVLLRDGIERVAIVARDDSYGRGQQRDIVAALQRFGVSAEVITELTYSLAAQEDGGEVPPIPDLDQLVDGVIAAEPDGVVVVGFEEAAQLLEGLASRGVSFRS